MRLALGLPIFIVMVIGIIIFAAFLVVMFDVLGYAIIVGAFSM